MPATIWATLNDEHRRDLLELLRERPRAVTELVQELGLSQPSVSKHLRVLREAGFVRVAPAAQQRIYALDTAPLAELDAWLRPYRALWNDSLDALGRRLDETAVAQLPARPAAASVPPRKGPRRNGPRGNGPATEWPTRERPRDGMAQDRRKVT